VAMVLSAASISLARDSGPPTIDIGKLCRGNLDAMREVFAAGDLQGMGTCVADERPRGNNSSRTGRPIRPAPRQPACSHRRICPATSSGRPALR
jgi:hypothetical protein